MGLAKLTQGSSYYTKFILALQEYAVMQHLFCPNLGWTAAKYLFRYCLRKVFIVQCKGQHAIYKVGGGWGMSVSKLNFGFGF